MKKRLEFIVFFVFAGQCFLAQNTTINKDQAKKESLHKVMLIPFEPKLYNSEIDYQINKETKLNGKEIRHKFRDGINEQLYKAFSKNKYTVVDLMEDTVKFKKETNSIYSHLSYEYMKVPDQQSYRTPKKDKDEKAIQKGQLNIETKTDARFMNAKINSAQLVPLLYAKYKTDVFVFVNELDIKASMATTELSGAGNEYRKIIVHYTVYTYDAKEINSGIAEQDFPNDLNNPVKIIDKYFYKIAETISLRVFKALMLKN